MHPSLFRRHPAIASTAVVSIGGWVAFGFMNGSSSVPFYLGWMVVTSSVVVALDRRQPFSRLVLGGLTLWAFMHLGGGLLPVGDEVLYQQPLLTVFRYDQLTHLVGFGFAGLAVLEQAKPWLRVESRASSATLVLMGGLAAGALNEMLEFLLTRVVPSTNVGGFTNTGWDLVANTLGSLIAATWAAFRPPS